MGDIDMKMRVLVEDLASKKFQAIGKAADGTDKSSKKLGKTLVGLVSVGAATAFARSAISAYKTAGSQTLALQRATGGAAEEVSRLRFAAKQSGQDIPAFTAAINKANKTLVAAAGSSKATVEWTAKLGTDFVDAEGKVRPMVELLPEIADKFKELPNGAEKSALSLQLFGKTGAALLPFLNRGKEGIAALEAEADRLGITMGEKQLNAYKKSVAAQRELSASSDALKQNLGAELVPMITDGTEKLNGLLEVTGKIPGPMKSVAFQGAAAAGALLLLAPRAAATNAALLTMGPAGTKAAAGLSGLAKGAAAGAAVYGLVQVSNAIDDSFLSSMHAGTEKSDELAEALLRLNQGAVVDLPGRWYALDDSLDNVGSTINDLANPSNFRRMQDIGQWFSGQLPGVNTSWEDKTNEIKSLDGALANLADNGHGDEAAAMFRKWSQAALDAGASTDDIAKLFPTYVAATGGAVSATEQLGGAADQTGQDLQTMFDKLNAAISPMLGLDQATLAYKDSLTALTGGMKTNGDEWSKSTEKGRANRSLVLASIQDAGSYAEAVKQSALARGADEAAAGEKATRAYQKKIAGIRDTLEQMGVEKSVIDDLLRKYEKVPKRLTTKFDADVEKAIADINRLYGAGSMAARQNSGRGIPKNATGGLFRGRGSGTSDSNVTRISDGEFIVNAQDTAKNLPLLEAINSGADTFASGGKKGGGKSGGKLKVLEGIRDKAAAKLEKITSRLEQLQSERESLVSSTKSSVQGFGSIGGFDVNAHADAMRDLAAATQGVTDAESGLFDARRRANAISGPKTDKDKAAALDEVARAEQAVTDAKNTQAAAQSKEQATAVTAGNVLGAMREKLAKARGFKTVLQKLQKAGLNKTTLADVIAAGPVDGTALGEALLSSVTGVKEANTLQAGLNDVAGGIGKLAGDAEYGDKIARQEKRQTAAGKAYNRAQVNVAKAKHGDDYVTVPLHLFLDGEQVVAVLKKVKRRKRQKLGLD